MDYHLILRILHLLGFALGLGGASISDYIFFKYLKDKKITKQEFSTLQNFSVVLWTGLFLLITSGAGLVYMNTMRLGHLPQDGRFYAKMTIVLVITMNGFLFQKLVFPKLKTSVLLSTNKLFMRNTGLVSMIGTISIVSWYSAFLLGAYRAMPWSYTNIILLYTSILICGSIVGNMQLKKMLKSRA